MAVKQLSVYLTNRAGSLVRVTDMLADAGINLYSVCIADTEEYGILRVTTNDTDRAYEILKAEGIPARVRNVVAFSCGDEVGGLSKVLRYLDEADINIEYMYSIINSEKDKAYMIMRVDDFEKAEGVLRLKNVETLSEDKL